MAVLEGNSYCNGDFYVKKKLYVQEIATEGQATIPQVKGTGVNQRLVTFDSDASSDKQKTMAYSLIGATLPSTSSNYTDSATVSLYASGDVKLTLGKDLRDTMDFLNIKNVKELVATKKHITFGEDCRYEGIEDFEVVVSTEFHLIKKIISVSDDEYFWEYGTESELKNKYPILQGYTIIK